MLSLSACAPKRSRCSRSTPFTKPLKEEGIFSGVIAAIAQTTSFLARYLDYIILYFMNLYSFFSKTTLNISVPTEEQAEFSS